MGWAHCVWRLNRWLPEYGKKFATLAALDDCGTYGDPKVNAAREVLEAQLEETKSRMLQIMSGRQYFENTIEEEAQKNVALAAAAAARSEAKAAA